MDKIKFTVSANYKTYGENNFAFEILDQLEPKDDRAYDYTEYLKVPEKMWLEKLQPYGEKGCNKQTKMGH
ncbi:MAG: hypothetical protein M1495_19810 [Bacteroidetes bacterium]|nr:hypothetical protein [Bacteroidota bacterium]